jgi:hypothetical protein
MSQSLEIDLKTNSDVPQAMEKAKAATESFNKQVQNISKNTKKATDGTKEAASGFGKQVEGIGAKFATSFKDIFLSFLGPMALVTGAIAIISRMIAENQKKQEEANQAAIDGTNELMSAEDRYWARKQAKNKKEKEDTEEAKTERINVTEEFLNTRSPSAIAILKREEELQGPTVALAGGAITAYGLARDPKIQAEVQALIAEEAKKNPSIAGQMDRKSDSFKGPEGFSNVIGVGANPVLEAMTKQVEVLEEIKVILEQSKPGGGVPQPFTEKPISLRGVFNA